MDCLESDKNSMQLKCPTLALFSIFPLNHMTVMSIGSCLHVCVNSKIGEDQSAEDAEDGPPELLVSN